MLWRCRESNPGARKFSIKTSTSLADLVLSIGGIKSAKSIQCFAFCFGKKASTLSSYPKNIMPARFYWESKQGTLALN
jgi:hypothetical protein